jgi:hypothetical protein
VPAAGSDGRAGASDEGLAPDLPLETPVSMPGRLYVQEDELGFAAVDGNVVPRQADSSVTGYTGTGYADGDAGIGKTLAWSLRAERAGNYQLVWRYSFGGTEANLRDARLLINGEVAVESVVFPYTGSWNDWQQTAPLDVALPEGSIFVQLQATYPSGLANFDYLLVLGEGITPDQPSFSLAVEQNVTEGGSVQVSQQRQHQCAADDPESAPAASDNHLGSTSGQTSSTSRLLSSSAVGVAVTCANGLLGWISTCETMPTG